MITTFKSLKLESCKDELKILLEKLVADNYKQTAEVVFDHVAHTGVETDLDKNLKTEPTLEEFLKSE